MTEQDRQLVELITQQVIAVLRERGAGQVAGERADIHPPIGQCTGDYSKFPELAGKLYGAGRGGNVGEKLSEMHPSPQPSPQGERGSVQGAIPLSGIVTANQLQAAMDTAADGVAVLAVDARLSPLANDLARKFAKRVRRAAPGSAAGPGGNISGGDLTALPWMWWIDGICPVVQEVTSQRASRLRLSGAARSPGGLSQLVRDLAAAIRGRQVAGGLLFVHNAARAMCLANRCASIRAVVGTCGEAVEQGINELGANVLVIEYPHHGVRSTSAMVDRMLQQPPRVPAAVERELADLHRCG